MSEFVLILFLLIPGVEISDPAEVGTFRSLDACEAEATRQADDESIVKDRRFAAVWLCVKRDK